MGWHIWENSKSRGTCARNFPRYVNGHFWKKWPTQICSKTNRAKSIKFHRPTGPHLGYHLAHAVYLGKLRVACHVRTCRHMHLRKSRHWWALAPLAHKRCSPVLPNGCRQLAHRLELPHPSTAAARAFARAPIGVHTWEYAFRGRPYIETRPARHT